MLINYRLTLQLHGLSGLSDEEFNVSVQSLHDLCLLVCLLVIILYKQE